MLPLPVNLALIIKKSGGDLDDFVVSISTTKGEGVKAVTEDADDIKENKYEVLIDAYMQRERFRK